MKFTRLGLALVSALAITCTSGDKKVRLSDSLLNHGRQQEIDSALLIVPGKAIGQIFIGQNSEDLKPILGNADGGDAAMGKAWGIWLDKTDAAVEEYAIYTTYADTAMKAKVVKQVRTEAKKYKLAGNIGVGSSLNDVKIAYKNITQLPSYYDARLGDTIKFYDAVNEGIGFEMLRDQVKAITVHEPNKAMNQTYLTLHPEWKLVEEE